MVWPGSPYAHDPNDEDDVSEGEAWLYSDEVAASLDHAAKDPYDASEGEALLAIVPASPPQHGHVAGPWSA
eukprot:3190412-Prorocentrum_lima.AAC.1